MRQGVFSFLFLLAIPVGATEVAKCPLSMDLEVQDRTAGWKMRTQLRRISQESTGKGAWGERWMCEYHSNTQGRKNEFDRVYLQTGSAGTDGLHFVRLPRDSFTLPIHEKRLKLPHQEDLFKNHPFWDQQVLKAQIKWESQPRPIRWDGQRYASVTLLHQDRVKDPREILNPDFARLDFRGTQAKDWFHRLDLKTETNRGIVNLRRSGDRIQCYRALENHKPTDRYYCRTGFHLSTRKYIDALTIGPAQTTAYLFWAAHSHGGEYELKNGELHVRGRIATALRAGGLTTCRIFPGTAREAECILPFDLKL